MSYAKSTWDDYALAFARITTRFQAEMLMTISQDLTDSVADLGCGAVKIAPYLLKNERVRQYVGVDCSAQMIAMAQQTVQLLADARFSVLHADILQVHQSFDCLLSVNSFYTWPNPQQILLHLRQLCHADSRLILVTPNPRLDMARLIQQAEPELLLHPDWAVFKAHNLALAQHPKANFLEMADLLAMLMQAGFRVEQCHQQFYLGGVNVVYCGV